MVPGLKRILDLIKASPNDPRLVDRYLALAGELSDDERVDANLQLALAFTNKFPMQAVDLAWALFKNGEQETESLSVIAHALDSLGKKGRAESLRAEAKRLSQNPRGSDAHERARVSIERTISQTQGKMLAEFSDENHTKTNSLKVSDQSQSASKGLKGVATFDLVDPKNVEVAAPTVLLEVKPVSEKVRDIIPVKEVSAASQSKNVAGEGANSPVAIGNQTASKRQSVARVSAAQPGAGIPEAIPRKETSKHSKAILERNEKPAANGSSGTTDLGNHSTKIELRDSFSQNLSRSVQEIVAAKDWEGLLELVETRSIGDVNLSWLEIFQAHRLQKIDVRFAKEWINTLISHKQERRALRFILEILIEEPYLAWARMAKPKVDEICSLLNLRPINWQDSDGVTVLRRQIEQLRPLTGVYVVGLVTSA